MGGSEAAKAVTGKGGALGLLVSAGLLILATGLLLAMPTEVTVRVGDDAARVHLIGRMGYPKSIFSLARRPDPDGRIPTPSAYSIGDDWHLLIWHKDKIERMTHFLYVSRGPGRYGEWEHVRKVDSFSVSRPSIAYYFLGLGIGAAVGTLMVKFPRIFYLLLNLYIALCMLRVIAVSCFAETFAADPMLRLVGVASGAVLGRRITYFLATRPSEGGAVPAASA